MFMRTDCRCCRGTNLTEVFDLGQQPLANAFLRSEQLELKYPLTLKECNDCGMVQLGHVVDASTMFTDYSFLTGSSQYMADHFAKLMNENAKRYVPEGGLVVEIGSNDGTALSSIQTRRLGIDPAANLSDIARKRGVPTITGFFTESLANEVTKTHGQAHLIVACNVLGHIDDLDNICRGVKTLLHPNGAFVVEVPHVNWLISKTEYDTIYHEHLSYFAVRPLATLFSRHGLRITQIETQEVHGGSLRLTIQHGMGHNSQAITWIEGELKPRDWSAFRQRCESSKQRLVDWLVTKDGDVVGYGAPAKATVRLNYCGIGTNLLPSVVDSTPNKQGHFIPGTHQPIYDPKVISDTNNILILAWNHEKEIRSKLINFTGQITSVSEFG